VKFSFTLPTRGDPSSSPPLMTSSKSMLSESDSLRLSPISRLAHNNVHRCFPQFHYSFVASSRWPVLSPFPFVELSKHDTFLPLLFPFSFWNFSAPVTPFHGHPSCDRLPCPLYSRTTFVVLLAPYSEYSIRLALSGPWRPPPRFG